MIFLTLLAALTSSPLPPPVPPAPSPEAAALRVVEAFRADDIVALHALAAEDIADGWKHADHVVEGLECISVPEAVIEEVVPDGDTAAVVRTRLRGWGTTSGAVKVERRIVPLWFISTVRVDGGWAVAAVRPYESLVVSELAAMPDDTARRERLMREQDLDLAIVLNDLSDVGSAEARGPLIEFTIAEALAVGDLAVASSATSSLVVYHLFAGSTADAKTALDECMRLAQQSGNADRMASAVHIRAGVSWFSGDTEAAAADYARAAEMIDRITDARTAHMARTMEQVLHGRGGNNAGELASSFALQEQLRRFPWLEGTHNVHAGLQRALEDLGYPAALDHARMAYGVARRLRKKSLIAIAAGVLADGLLLRGEHAEALQIAREALPKATRGVEAASLRLSIATALAELDDRESAVAEAERAAQETDDTWLQASALTLASDLHRRAGRLEVALEKARHAVRLSQAEGLNRSASTPPTIGPRSAEAQALRALGRCEEAAAAYREAIQTAESHRTGTSGAEARTRHLQNRGLPYLGLLEVLLDDGRVEDALRVSELFKGRTLRDALPAEEPVTTDGLTALAVEKARALESEIARLNVLYVSEAADAERRLELQQALRSTREELDILRASAVSSRRGAPELTRAALASDSLSRPDLLVPSDSDVILDYVGGRDGMTLFIITRDGAELRVSVRRIALPATRLEAQVSAFVKMLEARDLGYVDGARELYRLLLAPAEQELAAARTVAIIPDGPLWNLPFAALRDAEGRHLVERVSLFYAPSLAMFERPDDVAPRTNERPRAESVLAVGNPNVSKGTAAVLRAATGGLGPLPDAARESRSIASMYRDVRVLIGADATEEAVKREAGGHDILHFATHALEQTAQPLYSSIVLAQQPGAKDDGLLEAREILELDLRADLVVLSACSTARGAVRWGEGSVGLPWAFFLAGSKRTIVAQWPIDSAATADTMVELHRALRRRGGATEAAAALRDAQLAIQRSTRYAHPYYWAAFAVIGDAWPRARAPHRAGRRGDRPPAVRTRQQLH